MCHIIDYVQATRYTFEYWQYPFAGIIVLLVIYNESTVFISCFAVTICVTELIL